MEDVASFCDEMGMAAYIGWSTDQLLLSQARATRLFPVGQRRFLVQNKSMSFELSERAAAVWRTLRTPLTRPELVKRTAKRWRLDEAEASQEISGLLRWWKRYGLVRLS